VRRQLAYIDDLRAKDTPHDSDWTEKFYGVFVGKMITNFSSGTAGKT